MVFFKVYWMMVLLTFYYSHSSYYYYYFFFGEKITAIALVAVRLLVLLQHSEST